MLEAFNQLPEPGGVLDQNTLLLNDILLYKAIRDALIDEQSDDDNNDFSHDIGKPPMFDNAVRGVSFE